MAEQKKELVYVAPDIKRPFDATVPSLPKAAMLLPILIYLWVGFNIFVIGKNYVEVQMMKKSYPAHVAEKQQLDTKISAYKAVLQDADSQFETFRLWKGWLLESPPMAQLIAAVLNSIQSDVRITTLDFSKELDYPSRIGLVARLALTSTDPSKQFDMLMQALDAVGWRIGGSVDQAVDSDAERLYPTPNGAPRELFYRLSAALTQKVDAETPNVPITMPEQPKPEAATPGTPK